MPTTEINAPIDAPRGLAGVVVTETELGDVRGREGFYHYRQYSAVELATARTFEDVWYLMFHGRLPDAVRFLSWKHRGPLDFQGPSAAQVKSKKGKSADRP